MEEDLAQWRRQGEIGCPSLHQAKIPRVLEEILKTFAEDASISLRPSVDALASTLDMLIAGHPKGKGVRSTREMAKDAIEKGKAEVAEQSKAQSAEEQDSQDRWMEELMAGLGDKPAEEKERDSVDEETQQDPVQPLSQEEAQTPEKADNGVCLSQWNMTGESRCDTCNSVMGQWAHACPGKPKEGDVISYCPGCEARIPRRPGLGGHAAGTHRRVCRANFPDLWDKVAESQRPKVPKPASRSSTALARL